METESDIQCVIRQLETNIQHVNKLDKSCKFDVSTLLEWVRLLKRSAKEYGVAALHTCIAENEKNTQNLLISEKQAIIIWRFDDAPEEYRKLSPHGGDEDWVAFVPKHLVDKHINWMQSESSFGFDVSEHIVEDGVIRISSH